VSETPFHTACPRPSRDNKWYGPSGGNAVPVYVRERGEVEMPRSRWGRFRRKRTWRRVGTLCLDCQAFAFGRDEVPDGPWVVDRPTSGGLPSAAATGLPTSAASGRPQRSLGSTDEIDNTLRPPL